MNGTILYTYKKSTYYREIENLSEYNYIIGFGEDQINNLLKGEQKEIANIISKEISIEICFDFQKNIKSKKFDNAIYNPGDSIIDDINTLKLIRKNVENYDKKKIIIIQSNFTNLFFQLNILPINKIICKCDPLQQSVFKLRDKNEIEEINKGESHFLNLIEKVKKNEKIVENKAKRLNNQFFEFQNNYEYLNCHKLINEFKYKKSSINLENHQFMIFEYDLFEE